MGEYHSDKPINSIHDDLYGRIKFTHKLTKVLSNLDRHESFVIGLYAKWGFGKTSTVNLIQKGLDTNFCSIYINAWALDGDTTKILWAILSNIHLSLNGKKLKRGAGWLGEKVGRFPVKLSFFGVSASTEDISEMLSSLDRLEKAKKKVSSAINSGNKQIVVFLDDIDRLPSQQIIEIFRMMNAIADYGGITYVLPFDKEYVCAAIEEYLPENQSGSDYIEKIVQVPLHLPTIPQFMIEEVFTSRLDDLIREYSIGISQGEVERFSLLYHHCDVKKYIKSPRDINKIFNSLRFALLINKGEASIVDTIVIDILRVFDKPFYDKIKMNKKLLVASEKNFIDYMTDDDSKKRKNEFENAFKENSDNFHQDILRELFPEVAALYDPNKHIDNYNLRKEQRVASEYFFESFFTAYFESNNLSTHAILELLEKTGDTKALKEGLGIVNSENCDFAFKLIEENEELIGNKLNLCLALLDLVETFPEDRTISFSLDPFARALKLIDILLKSSGTRLDDYFSLLKHNFENDRIHTISFLIRQVVLKSNKEKQHDYIILNEEELSRYKQFALSIIQDISKNKKMPIGKSKDDSGALYFYWIDFGNERDVKSFVTEQVGSAVEAIDFISMFLGRWSPIGSGKPHRGDLDMPTFATLSKIIDLDYFYTLIVKNGKYRKHKGISSDKLPSFEDDELNGLSLTGNEHTDEFRDVVAKRYIYFFENDSIA